jgi:nucleotide-binding universal stress UspA family protein
MRLLIATGGSSHSDAALQLGAHILRAQEAGDITTILTVIRRESKRPQANLILAQARKLLEAEVPEVQTRVRLGRPAEEIISEANEGSYDLVILGERPTHRLTTRFLGSTAIQVAEHASCPVIIVKAETGPIQRILLCDSGAESGSLLSRFTAQLARLTEGQVELIVLHVMSQMSAGPGVKGKQLRATAPELIKANAPEGDLLAGDIRMLEEPEVHPRPKVRHGLVVDEILAEARSGNYDLVVIGSHQSEGWQRFLLDNLAHQILVKVDRPILIVR